MKSLYIAAALSFLLLTLSCTKEGEILPTFEENNEVIPVEDALELVIEYAKLLYPETRSDQSLSVSDAITLTKKDLPKATRSTASSEIPDTTLYIFNFANNSGYAVASANRKYGKTLFCITESGRLSAEDFAPIHTRVSGDSTDIHDGTHFITDLLTASIMANEIAPPDSTEVGGGPGGIIGPFLMTKWGQSISPFNDSTYYNYPAGCTVIAVAQIMAYEEYANTMVFNGVLCDWDDMKTVHTFPSINDSGSTLGKIQVANFIKELGAENNCDLTYTPTESSGFDFNAKKTLNNYGYSATMTPLIPSPSFTHNMHSRVRTQLFSGRPVYVGAMMSISEGHAWVIDGSFAGLYHINWGWLGDNDGYFSAGIFSIADRVSTSSIDPGSMRPDSYNYSFGFHIITYTL